jgi:regulator of replication initiation timing
MSEKPKPKLNIEDVKNQIDVINFRLKDFLREVSVLSGALIETLVEKMELEKENKSLKEKLSQSSEIPKTVESKNQKINK